MRREATLVLAIFLVTQLLDGTLTYVGVHRFGIEAEGNVLLTSLMQSWGTGPALLAAKLFSSACGLLLFTMSVYRVLAAAAGACIGLAIVPWIALLVYGTWVT